MENSILTPRKQKLLAMIVEKYITTGEPVGSKTLCEALDMAVSSATIRNEMAELSEMGYLEQPHTSAGRIPSQKGYRYYVDNLMGVYELNEEERRGIASWLEPTSADPDKVLERAGGILAQLTNCAVVSTSPSDTQAVIRRAELVPIGTHTAMIVMLTSAGTLKSRVCRVDCELTLEVIESFYNIASKHFIGRSANDISTAMIQTLAAALGEKALLMTPLLVALSELAEASSRLDIRLDGQSNLLNYREFYENAFELMEFLHHSNSLAQLVTRGRGDTDIKIGTENLFRELENSSTIMSRYFIGGHDSGSLGIIGPTRMDYAKIVPSIKYLSQLVGSMLSDTLDS
ncbi:MAG: heat-inducible transcription repressor HrcA [Clostridiales bacterium]|nr:heat-inducible transcription repressor HrcA [Clostridiales bacterium]